jgi:photosystem II stability/assembly factor-like uncharacterized protein
MAKTPRPARDPRPTVFFAALLVFIALGPPLVAATWTRLGLAGEALETVAIHPSDPELLFAGGGPENGSGVFRSTDGGATWASVNTGLGAVARVNAITFDAATATAPIYLGVLKLGGPNLFKSTNLGATWQPAVAGLPSTQAEVTAIVFDPLAAGTGYAAINGQTSGGVSKTTNGGASWSDASTGLADGFCTLGCVLDLAIDPSAPATLYAALPVSGDVYKTTDGGGSWAPTGSAFAARKLALARSEPASVAASGGIAWEHVMRTTDGGLGWTEISGRPGLPPASTSRHRAIAVDPTDAEIVWAVVEDFSRSPEPFEAVYRSEDGGLSWTLTDAGLDSVRVQDLVHHAGWVFAATDDGVYRIFDGLFADGFETGDLLAWSAVVP